jgi:hypothetical protein
MQRPIDHGRASRHDSHDGDAVNFSVSLRLFFGSRRNDFDYNLASHSLILRCQAHKSSLQESGTMTRGSSPATEQANNREKRSPDAGWGARPGFGL